MGILKRFGVSVDENLLKKFDSYLKRKNYKTRSEAIRDLIRKALVEEEWIREDRMVAGTITLVYDHHQKELSDKLTKLQHNYYKIIISTQHIHLDHNICLEIIVVKGKIKDIYNLQSKLKATKGVKHASLSKSTLSKQI